MKNPFRGAHAAAPSSAASSASAPPPGAPSPVWPTLRGATLGLALLVTTGFLGYDSWVWRQSAEAQTQALSNAQLSQRRLARHAQTLVGERDQARRDLIQARQHNETLSNTVQNLEQEHRKISEAHQRLEDEMRSALESRDVTISELAGQLTVNILDRVLFASGQAEITEEGQQVLREVATVLGQFPDRPVQVLGHTDNVPIHTGQFPSNWELSAARALAAVRFLTEAAGVDPRRLGALAQGEFHPLADNSTPEGRAQNRRIAIVVLPARGEPDAWDAAGIASAPEP